MASLKSFYNDVYVIDLPFVDSMIYQYLDFYHVVD